MKKPKKPRTLSWYKKDLWKIFSLYIRTRDGYTCFTCGKVAAGSGMHAGHFVPRSLGGIALYFHEDNVHAQCYRCNINLSGNQWEYGERLGSEKVKELMALKRTSFKVDKDWYIKQTEKYRAMLAEVNPQVSH